MKSTWLLILMVMLTVQTLGLSHAAPLYGASSSAETDAKMAMDTHNTNGDMPCHSSDVSDSMGQVDVSNAMADCCAEQDCSCCWGCSGLLSAVFSLGTARFSSYPSMQEATRNALSGNPTSLYRPPIFA